MNNPVSTALNFRALLNTSRILVIQRSCFLVIERSRNDTYRNKSRKYLDLNEAYLSDNQLNSCFIDSRTTQFKLGNTPKIHLGIPLSVDYLSIVNAQQDNRQHITITTREYEVLTLVASEFSNKEIATQLHVAVGTVESHRKNLFMKLGARNMAGLIRRAFDSRILYPKE